MPKKDSDSKGKKGKSSEKGSVGYFCGGALKGGFAYLFSSEDSAPQELYDETRKFLGKYVQCKYVNVEDVDKVFGKFKKALAEHEDYNETVYNVHSSTAMDTLKKVSGVDRSHILKEKATKDDKPKKSTKGKGKGKDKDSDDEDASGSDNEDASGSDDEKPKKGAKGKAKGKATKGKGKGKGKDSDDEDASGSDGEDASGSDKEGSEDDASGSDDDAPKKGGKGKSKGKKEEKKGKGKSK